MKTRVGYAGGTHDDPTYHDLGNHTEAVEVTFDPRRISFAALLDVYWQSFPLHLPPAPSRVRTAVISRGGAQTRAAMASKDVILHRSGEPVHTRVIPDGAFWPAERMHQKFNLQRVYPALVAELVGDADLDTFLASTAATQLNAYVSGFPEHALLAAAGAELGIDVQTLAERLEPP